jgi:hypothetical protein
MKSFAFALLTCLFLLAIPVLAQSGACTDLDDGPVDDGEPEPYIATTASVKYGISEKTDECVSGKDGYHKDPSLWVREYYCGIGEAGVQRKYRDYDCTRYGYTGCEGGKCIGKSAEEAKKTSSGPAQASCGDKKVQSEMGENCDPPDSICYSEGTIGICTRPNDAGLGGCQCKLYSGGSGTVTVPAPEETAEEPSEAQEETFEEEPEEETADEAMLEEEKQEPAVEERQPLPEEFKESKGVGFTRSISNAVKGFFKWIGSWFD